MYIREEVCWNVVDEALGEFFMRNHRQPLLNINSQVIIIYNILALKVPQGSTLADTLIQMASDTHKEDVPGPTGDLSTWTYQVGPRGWQGWGADAGWGQTCLSLPVFITSPIWSGSRSAHMGHFSLNTCHVFGCMGVKGLYEGTLSKTKDCPSP